MGSSVPTPALRPGLTPINRGQGSIPNYSGGVPEAWLGDQAINSFNIIIVFFQIKIYMKKLA